MGVVNNNMAATSPAAKLLQRKLYTFVSSKWGLPVCVLGVLLLLISIFQFGEVRRLHFIGIEHDHSSFANTIAMTHRSVLGVPGME